MLYYFSLCHLLVIFFQNLVADAIRSNIDEDIKQLLLYLQKQLVKEHCTCCGNIDKWKKWNLVTNDSIGRKFTNNESKKKCNFIQDQSVGMSKVIELFYILQNAHPIIGV